MAQIKRITFKHGDKEIPSMSKFLSYLYHTGSTITRWDLEHNHVQKKEQGTITIDDQVYTFQTVYIGTKSPAQEHPQSSAFGADAKLTEHTHKVIHELTPTHHLELTLSYNNTLLNTKSISLS